MKPIVFLGDSRACLQAFPTDARARAGYQLREVQNGREPSDCKSMRTIGSGVREIRIGAMSGAYRIIYVAEIEGTVVVLHAFQKKSRRTAKPDIDIATGRLKAWKG